MFILQKCTFIFLCCTAKKWRQEDLQRNYFARRQFAAFGKRHTKTTLCTWQWSIIIIFLKHREREKERESIRTAAAEDSNQKEGVYTCCCLAPFYLGNVCWPDNKGFFLEISGRHYRCRLQRNTLNYTTLHWSTHQLPPWLPGTGPDCGRWGGVVIFHAYINMILHTQAGCLTSFAQVFL